MGVSIIKIMTKPTLVLISGAPGTGKTVLARKLAAALPVVALEGDSIKETLYDVLGLEDRRRSKKFGIAMYELLYLLIEAQLRAGQSVIVDAAFRSEFAQPRIADLSERYEFDFLEVHCHSDLDVVVERYLSRASSGERHPGHDTGMGIDEVTRERQEQFGHYGPVTSGDSLIRVDTTDFAKVDYVGIIEVVRNAVG